MDIREGLRKLFTPPQEPADPRPKKVITPRAAKYQPHVANYILTDRGWKADTSLSSTAVHLSDIPVGQYAKVFLKKGRFKDHYETQREIARVLEVKQTPQNGNEIVVVQIDGWANRKILLAGGTSAIRLESLG